MRFKIKSIKLNISNLLLNKAFLLYCMSYSTYGYINETNITILSSKNSIHYFRLIVIFKSFKNVHC